jgi:hypothetical protein
MIAVLMLVLYCVVNVVLFRMRGEQYVQSDFFLFITSIFALMFVVGLPRMVGILLGFESQAPNHDDKELLGTEYDSEV